MVLTGFLWIVYQAAHDALQTTRALEGGQLGSRTLDTSTSNAQGNNPSTSADDSTGLNDTADDAEWIYADRPGPSD